jgi:hypothetical protein
VRFDLPGVKTFPIVFFIVIEGPDASDLAVFVGVNDRGRAASGAHEALRLDDPLIGLDAEILAIQFDNLLF